MKTRLTLAIIAILLSAVQVYAQHCGFIPITCVGPPLSQQGFTPSQNISCIIPGGQTDFMIKFKGLSQVEYMGETIALDSITIDSIGNLPGGLCWLSDKPWPKYAANEDGCIQIVGDATGAPAGQYKLIIYVTLHTLTDGLIWGINAEEIGIKQFLRVAFNSTIPCGAVNNNQTDLFVPATIEAEDVVQLTGTVFRDINANGLKDGSEFGMPNIRIGSGNEATITNAQGEYSLYVLAGNHTIAPLSNPNQNMYIFTPGTVVVNNTTLGNQYAGNNFALTLPQGYCQAGVSVVGAFPPPRPGFNNEVQVNVYNQLASAAISGTLRMSYNQSQVVSATTPVAANIDTVGRFIEWNISSLPLGGNFTTKVVFYTPQAVQLGTQHIYNISVLNSNCSGLDTLRHKYIEAVVGSYDPNDKAVSPIGFSDHHGINPADGNELTYRIRFQNTGTFYAEKVVIVDTISPNLDLTTLRVLSASANYEVNIGDDRAVKFIFNNIMLPDSNSNEPESHGYVQFAIKLNASLAQNTAITNKADIYFDFNDPIRTNTAYNTIDYTTGINEAEVTYNFNLFPNPTNSNVQITADEQLVGKPLKVTDLSGRVLLQRIVDSPVMTLQLSDLASGIYLIQVEGATKKIVKE